MDISKYEGVKKIYCIKTLNVERVRNKKFTFIEGKVYEMIYMNGSIRILDESNTWMEIRCKFGVAEAIMKFFITINEYRKLKIDSIINVSW